MPVNNNWRVEAGDFHYKAQDFTNSCFPACLQMALENFGLLRKIKMGHPGRPIEDEFNNFYTRTHDQSIDIEAPTRGDVEGFMLRDGFQYRHNVWVEYIKRMTTLDQELIMGHLFNNESVAIIGAMAAVFAHATMIFNRDGQVFVVNPDPQGGNYCERVENLDNFHFDFAGAPGPAGERQMVLFVKVKT